MVPSSLAEIKTSLKGWVAKPQIPPWVCPLIIVLEAAFFSPTSMISPSLVPTRIFPWFTENEETSQRRQSRSFYPNVSEVSLASGTSWFKWVVTVNILNYFYLNSQYSQDRFTELNVLLLLDPHAWDTDHTVFSYYCWIHSILLTPSLCRQTGRSPPADPSPVEMLGSVSSPGPTASQRPLL